MKIPGQQRKAISPIVATVLIIAATLIAAAAVAGYVFGIFGSSSSTANVSVTGTVIKAPASGTGATLVLACVAPATVNATLSWSNTGSGSSSATNVFISYGGSTYNAAFPTACAMTAGATGTVYIAHIPVVGGPGAAGAVKGNTFNGYIVVANGAQVSFTGTFT